MKGQLGAHAGRPVDRDDGLFSKMVLVCEERTIYSRKLASQMRLVAAMADHGAKLPVDINDRSSLKADAELNPSWEAAFQRPLIVAVTKLDVFSGSCRSMKLEAGGQWLERPTMRRRP